MMSNLVLDSLEIKNFRAFQHLQIEKLGRVNLIVGKNNVGKSSLLEALWLHGRRGDEFVIWDMLKSHDELSSSAERKKIAAEEQVEAIKYLFHGRQDIRGKASTVSMGPLDAPEQALSVSLQWMGLLPGGNGISINSETSYQDALSFGRLNPSIVVSYGQKMIATYSLVIENYLLLRTISGEKPCIFAPARDMTRTQMSELWDAIALTDTEADVLNALHLIAPEVERVNLIAEKGSSTYRNPTVKIKNMPTPIPLRSMGEGMNRMFGIILALVNAKDGMLLIDEVDTGLHYSVLPDLWKLIFEVAHRLNVQVFATSHSWDCIEAFQQAADENTEEEGMVIRLENQDGKVVPIIFDERKLKIATREQIEVR